MKENQSLYIPDDEREICEQDVFHAFDLTLPGLEKVSSYLKQGDMGKAKAELIHYLEKRTSVKFFYDYRNLPLKPIDMDSNPHDFQSALGLRGSLKEFCLYAGKKLMENIYVRPGRDRTTLDLGSGYENLPHFNYLTDLGKKQRTISDIFVRGQIFEYLAVLYHETGDKKVLHKFEEVLKVFWKNYPLVLEYTKPDASRFCLTEDRDVMSTGWLILNYIALFYTRIPYEINPELSFEIIKRIWFLGMQFRRFDEDSYRKYNHHMWERGLVPFMLGTLFPEIEKFTAVRDRGASIICAHIQDDFNESGGYSEHSIPYWSGAALCEMICRGVYLADVNNIPLLNEECKQRLYLTFNALALISPPQDLYSSVGDNGGPMVDPILQIGARATDNFYCSKVLQLRQEAGFQIDESLPLDYSNDRCGFFASRNGFGQNANFILMSAKVDCKDSGHNHMDMLSLFITFRGQEFIGEPHARQLYQRCRMNSSHRGYLYNMGAHNTVLVYGKPVQPDSMYANKWGVYRPDSPIDSFEAVAEGCMVEAYHDAYTTCRHRRKILFHRNKGILLQDHIEHGNRLGEDHIQRWNLMPDVSYQKIWNNGVLLEKNETKLLFFWTGSPTVQFRKLEELMPEIVKEGEPLSTLMDASFSPIREMGEDIATVSQTLLILDVTERNIHDIQPENLTQAISNMVNEKEWNKALSHFSNL